MQHEIDLKVCINLLYERKRLKYSRKKIADFLDMSEKQVQRWESSVSIPSDKLAELEKLGFNVYFVLTGNRACSDDLVLLAIIRASVAQFDLSFFEKDDELLREFFGSAYKMVLELGSQEVEVIGVTEFMKYYILASKILKSSNSILKKLSEKHSSS